LRSSLIRQIKAGIQGSYLPYKRTSQCHLMKRYHGRKWDLHTNFLKISKTITFQDHSSSGDIEKFVDTANESPGIVEIVTKVEIQGSDWYFHCGVSLCVALAAAVPGVGADPSAPEWPNRIVRDTYSNRIVRNTYSKVWQPLRSKCNCSQCFPAPHTPALPVSMSQRGVLVVYQRCERL
jgi:hypothetical protein